VQLGTAGTALLDASQRQRVLREGSPAFPAAQTVIPDALRVGALSSNLAQGIATPRCSQMTDREGKGAFYVTILDGLPAAG